MSPVRTPARPAHRSRRATTGRARRRPVTRGRSRSRSARLGTRRSPALLLARWWPALLIAAAVLAGVAWQAEAAPGATGRCVLPGTMITLSNEQVANATAITEVAQSRRLPARAVVIALATAQQESRLRNLDYGDRDSLGLFQQRPSQGWGTAAQVRDPAYAAGKFFDHLVQVPGWTTGRLTDVAQTVQRSGFPEAYQKWEPLAVELTAALRSDDPDAALGCS